MLDTNLKNYLIKFSKIINKKLHLECVILFGSRARSDYLVNSDLDLIFVGDFEEPFINRSSIVYDHYKLPLGLDAFCYRANEFDKMFHEGVVSILDAIDHGICVFGIEFYKNYKEKLEKLKEKGLKRDPPVWILPESMYLD
ncbi:MAG: nucleotidyltransferase domain-containing protein [Candidatus Thorarchaeota archaeon]